MKILHTESSQGWGGQEIRILEEAQGMQARGHELVIGAPATHRIHQEAEARGLAVADLPLARKRAPGLIALRRWLSAHRPDVVNTHSSTDSWLTSLACATLASPPALVRTRHISAPVARTLSNRWLYGTAAAHVVTTGEMLREQLIRDNGIAPSHVTSVPTGIRPELFFPGDPGEARRTLGLPEDGLLIGIVATLRSWKGHRYLVDAFARLARPNARLIIVGTGPQREGLERQVFGARLGEHVHLVGDQRHVAPWLRAFDVFALPSYANEGVPQALVQAMMSGLACVTTEAGAISEVARDGETALVVPAKDVDALAQALARLADDAALRARLGAAARAHCIAQFGFETMLARMEAIFARVSASRAR
jgi:glycosyltransferase involved in cell wall biosynthesis